MTTAAVMTYDSLVENIQSYLERNDASTLAKIPLFIMLAEQIIASQIKFLGNLTVNTSTMTAGQATIDKPARWHKTVSMNITVDGQRQPVLLRKYEYLRSYWPDPSATDTPLYYCDYDYTHWMVAPTPSSAYNLRYSIMNEFNLWIHQTKPIGLLPTLRKPCSTGPSCKLCRSLRTMSACQCGNRTTS